MAKINIILPEYPRIPHLDKSISKMTHDDILSDGIKYPIDCYVQEKIDGSNMGVSWKNDSAIIRNRKHILKKGYSKIRTPSKEQFKSAWNWVNDHRNDIKKISNKLMSEITIYGDWMLAYHSIKYDQLPDWFIAYDIWIMEDKQFLSPKIVEELLSETNISYVKPYKVILNDISDVIKWSELKSDFIKDGIREGIVIKKSNGDYIENSYKVVNKFFEIRDNFNEKLIKNNKIKL